MNFRKTDHSNNSNEQFLLGFILSCKIFLTCVTNFLYLLPVALCQSKRLTSLSIARWQTAIFVINSVHNNGHGIFVVVHMDKLSFSFMLTGEYHIESVLTEPDSSYPDCLLIVCYVSTAVKFNRSQSTKYKYVQNHSSLFECEEK